MSNTYVLGNEIFNRKEDIRLRCREIISSIKDGQLVDNVDQAFLVQLFSFHDEWGEKYKKSSALVSGITAKTTVMYNSRCFVILMDDGSEDSISYLNAIKCIPSGVPKKTPKYLVNFKAAARSAIADQIESFRQRIKDDHIELHCPITGESLWRVISHVDHEPPLTFDQMLFDFCKERNLNFKISLRQMIR